MTGQILDPDNNPVAGASVAVINSAEQILGQAVTDKNGFFDISSAVGSGLTLRVTYNGANKGDFFLNSLQLDPDETEDTGPIVYNLAAVDPQKNQFPNPFANFAQAIDAKKQFDALYQRVEADQFPTDQGNYITLTCPECEKERIAAFNAQSEQIVEAGLAYGAQQKLLSDIRVYGLNIITETATIIGFCDGLAALALGASTLAGFTAELTGVAEFFETVTSFATSIQSLIDIANELRNPDNEPKTTLQEAAEGTSAAARCFKFGVALEKTVALFTGKEVNKKLAVVAFVAEYLDKLGEAVGFFKTLQFTKTKEAAEIIEKDEDKYKEAKEKYNDATDEMNDKAREYNDCLAKNDANGSNCSNNGQGGAAGNLCRQRSR